LLGWLWRPIWRPWLIGFVRRRRCSLLLFQRPFLVLVGFSRSWVKTASSKKNKNKNRKHEWFKIMKRSKKFYFSSAIYSQKIIFEQKLRYVGTKHQYVLLYSGCFRLECGAIAMAWWRDQWLYLLKVIRVTDIVFWTMSNLVFYYYTLKTYPSGIV